MKLWILDLTGGGLVDPADCLNHDPAHREFVHRGPERREPIAQVRTEAEPVLQRVRLKVTEVSVTDCASLT